jgi:hypothetical protein
MRYVIQLLVFLVVVCSPVRGWGWGGGPSPPQPRFSSVPAHSLAEGSKAIRSLEQGANAESFMDIMLGTNCYSRAVAALKQDCKYLDQEMKSWLALRLANCQLATQGSATFACRNNDSLRKCVENLSDREHQLYVEFLTHVDSMCLFIQNQHFEKYTENMLNRLAAGAGYAQTQLDSIFTRTEQLSADTAAARASAEDAVIRLREARELQLAVMDVAREHRAESLRSFFELQSTQNAALQLAEQQLQVGRNLGEAQTVLAARIADGQAAISAVFADIDNRANELSQAQDASLKAHDMLATEMKALTEGSQGLRSAVDTVAEYQRRSDAALVQLLGRSYSFDDAVFYAASLLIAASTGAFQRTQSARMPLIALLALALLAERAIVDRFHTWLHVSPSGDIKLDLPVLMRLLPASASCISLTGVKWILRRAAASCGAILLVWKAWHYDDQGLERLQILRDIDARQSKMHQELRDAFFNSRVAAIRTMDEAARQLTTPQQDCVRRDSHDEDNAWTPQQEVMLVATADGVHAPAPAKPTFEGHATYEQHVPSPSSQQLTLNDPRLSSPRTALRGGRASGTNKPGTSSTAIIPATHSYGRTAARSSDPQPEGGAMDRRGRVPRRGSKSASQGRIEKGSQQYKASSSGNKRPQHEHIAHDGKPGKVKRRR